MAVLLWLSIFHWKALFHGKFSAHSGTKSGSVGQRLTTDQKVLGANFLVNKSDLGIKSRPQIEVVVSIAKVATNIDCYESIAQLQQLNGIPIAVIEQRARPDAYAAAGFLGRGEKLKDVLQQDWKTVQALGTTHIELAAHLRKIWDQVAAQGGKADIFYQMGQVPNGSLQEFLQVNFFVKHSQKIFFALGIITSVSALVAMYTVSSLFLFVLIPAVLFPVIGYVSYGTSSDFTKLGENLAGRIDVHKGLQEDLFDPSKGWNEQLVLTNSSSQQSVIVARGVIDYIEKYGFYEGGGSQNPYRIDPLKLVSILTGASISKLQLRCKTITA